MTWIWSCRRAAQDANLPLSIEFAAMSVVIETNVVSDLVDPCPRG